jgi:hypothetical protein
MNCFSDTLYSTFTSLIKESDSALIIYDTFYSLLETNEQVKLNSFRMFKICTADCFIKIY